MSTVQSVERSLDILETLALGPAGISELATATSLPKSTVARLIGTLEARLAVERNPGDARYRLGPTMAALAGAVTPSRNLMAVARPHLADLAKTTGEAAGLSVPDGYDVHYLDQVESTKPVQVRDWTGARIPMHVVPSGIVFMAEFPAAQLARYLDRDLDQPTPRTVVAPAAIRRKLAACRKVGYAWGYEEFAEGINSVASPVRGESGQVVAAIHVHGPAYRFPRRGREQAITEALAETVERMADQLGQPAR